MKLSQTIIGLLLLTLCFGCKVNQFHNKEKTGRWIYTDTVNTISYKAIGHYKKGIEKRTWRYTENDQLVKKEYYKNGVCYTMTYHEDGTLASKGKTKLTTTPNETHWCYFGDWFFYNSSGKIIRIKKYEEGELVQDTKLE